MTTMNDERGKGRVDLRILVPALLVVLGLSVPLAVDPEGGLKAVNAVFGWVTGNFGWAFLIFGAGAFALLMWLAFGRYGNVKLGSPDEAPEFRYLSWIAMLFTAGIGIGLMIWSVIEPIYYIQGPPYGIEKFSDLAYEWAHMLPQFHWGFSAWAIYCLPTIPVAYAVYVRKDPHLRVSTAARGCIGRHADGLFGVLLDLTVMFGVIGGVSTSLGLAVPLVSALFGNMFGMEDTFGLKMLILAIWTLIFGFSVYKGLSKGIKVLSDINLYLGVGLIAFIMIAGPTVFILSLWTNSLGLLLDNFFRMTFYMDPVAGGGWPQGWTIFYWAWWFAYMPMMALFVARISRGRTIREVVIAECVWGTLGCWLFLAVIGGYALYLNKQGIVNVSDILTNQGGPAACIAVMSQLPLSGLIIPVYTILSFIFLATTLDSSAYTLASVCTRELKGDEQPARWNRVFWALVLAVVAVGLLAVDALKAVQLASIIAALPLIPVAVILAISLLKWLKEDFGERAKLPEMAVSYADGSERRASEETAGDVQEVRTLSENQGTI